MEKLITLLSNAGFKPSIKAHPYTGGLVLMVVINDSYTLSCVNGPETYSCSATVEVAVVKDGRLDYSLTDGDVLGHQDPEEVLALALQIKQA